VQSYSDTLISGAAPRGEGPRGRGPLLSLYFSKQIYIVYYTKTFLYKRVVKFVFFFRNKFIFSNYSVK